MDPDKLFGRQLVLNALQTAFYHNPPVVRMDANIFIQTFDEMDLLQIDLYDFLLDN